MSSAHKRGRLELPPCFYVFAMQLLGMLDCWLAVHSRPFDPHTTIAEMTLVSEPPSMIGGWRVVCEMMRANDGYTFYTAGGLKSYNRHRVEGGKARDIV